ncbi:MAG: Hsp20/alpha crystallin family protein [Anaerolineales bacterium]
MSTLIRWDPIRELDGMHDVMDRLVEESLSRPLARTLWDITSEPSMDLYQTDAAVVVKMGLPGVKPDDIQVSVANGVLNIRGELKEEKEEKERIYHLRERRFGSFSRSVTLPSNVSAEKADAQFENGILTLTLPKAEEAKAKMITVRAKK